MIFKCARRRWSSIWLILTVCILTRTLASGLSPDDEGPRKEVAYDGYKVLRVHAESMDQLLYLRELSETGDTGVKINFWSEPSRLNSSVDVMVSPDLVTDVRTILEGQNMTTETLINDIGR